jgi:DNA-binding transcriptional MocR family regulator
VGESALGQSSGPDQSKASIDARQRRPKAAVGLLKLRLRRDGGGQPLYQQLRDEIRAAVLGGGLGVDIRLPSERELARALGINRATVVRAYQELVEEGLVTRRGSRGTVLNDGLESGDRVAHPEHEDETPAWLFDVAAHTGLGDLGPDPTLLRELAVSGSRPGMIPFAAAGPGPDMVPLDGLRASLEEALDDWGVEPLRYGPVEGFPPLLAALRARYTGDIIGRQDDVMVVSGATQGIEVVARALLQPGDEVIVEAPAYVGTIQGLGRVGARLIGVPVDQSGVRVDLIENVLSRRRIRLIAVQPTFHNPTGVTLSPTRRQHLLALAKRFAVPIFEDDPYRLLAYDGAPALPLKALDRDGSVIYLSSFSKCLASGLRVAWIAAHRAVLSRLVLAKQFSDLNSAGPPQAAVAKFLTSARFDTHLDWSLGLYRERRNAVVEELSAAWPEAVPMGQPKGGFHIWTRLPAPGTARQVMAAAARHGVSVVAGVAFYPPNVLGRDAGQDFLRLSFPEVTPEMAREGVRRLREAIAEVSALSTEAGGLGSRVLV